MSMKPILLLALLLSGCAATVEPEDTSGTWCFHSASNGNVACYADGFDTCEMDRLRHINETPDDACWREGTPPQ